LINLSPFFHFSYAGAGISIELSDPDPGLAFARNVLTLTCDLSAFENVRLAFDAREFGDEPHWPKDEEGRAKEEGDQGTRTVLGDSVACAPRPCPPPFAQEAES